MIGRINGIRLGYEVWGASGPCIVLIHGFGMDRTIWRDLASTFLDRWRVILPDLRGHGQSEAPGGVYEMPFLADDLVRLLDHLQINQAAVCGHSMGGYVALAFAAQYPQRLSVLGLIASRADADNEEKKQSRFSMIEDVREKGSIIVAESLAPKLSHDPAVVRRAFDLIERTSPQGLTGSLEGMARRPDRRDLLAKIDVPALIVAGEEDRIIPLDEAVEMASLLQQGELLTIPEAGHMPMLESKAVLAEGLIRLLNRS